MKNNNEFSSSDFPTFSALNCPAGKFPAIEEIDIRVNPHDRDRFEFVFENSERLQKKLSAFRKGQLRVEPSRYFHLCKEIRQEIKYLKDST